MIRKLILFALAGLIFWLWGGTRPVSVAVVIGGLVVCLSFLLDVAQLLIAQSKTRDEPGA
jgi:hypothetical protein